jgi:tRNA threonylcarbamoyladenosine biosynthesis protein TsaB
MSKILGIECAGASLSVAVLDGEKRLAFELITATSGYPEILVPTVQKVMKQAGLAYDDLDLIAAGRGAGSFTGVRIALATASAIAMVTDRPALGISNFAAAAFMIDEKTRATADMIIAAIETRRADFYIAAFAPDLTPLGEPATLNADKVKDMLKGKILIAGDAAQRLKDELVALLPSAADLTIVKDTVPTAETIAKYALYNQGANLPLTPLYVSPAHVTCNR